MGCLNKEVGGLFELLLPGCQPFMHPPRLLICAASQHMEVGWCLWHWGFLLNMPAFHQCSAAWPDLYYNSQILNFENCATKVNHVQQGKKCIVSMLKENLCMCAKTVQSNAGIQWENVLWHHIYSQNGIKIKMTLILLPLDHNNL